MHVGVLFSIHGGRKTGFVMSEGCCTFTKLSVLIGLNWALLALEKIWCMEACSAPGVLWQDTLRKNSWRTGEMKRTAQLVKCKILLKTLQALHCTQSSPKFVIMELVKYVLMINFASLGNGSAKLRRTRETVMLLNRRTAVPGFQHVDHYDQ